MSAWSLSARLREALLERSLARVRVGTAALCPPTGRVLDCRCGPDRPAPYPASAGRVVLEADISAARLPFGDGAFDAVVACMVLHALPLSLADAVLKELGRAAPLVIVADYCLPERNLALPAAALVRVAQRVAGGERYRRFRRFMAAGALEGLVGRHGLRLEARIHMLGGAAMAAVWRPARAPGAAYKPSRSATAATR